MYNTTVRFGFCDIQNKQGPGKGYQPQPLADNPYLDLDYSGYHKNFIQYFFLILSDNVVYDNTRICYKAFARVLIFHVNHLANGTYVTK